MKSCDFCHWFFFCKEHRNVIFERMELVQFSNVVKFQSLNLYSRQLKLFHINIFFHFSFFNVTLVKVLDMVLADQHKKLNVLYKNKSQSLN